MTIDELSNGDLGRTDFWGAAVEALAAELGQSGKWVPFLVSTYANGTPFPADIGPSFDAWNQELDRGIMVYHYAPDGGLGIAAWINDAPDFMVDFPSKQLVVNVADTDETLAIATELIRQWMDPNTTLEQIEEALTQMREEYL